MTFVSKQTDEFTPELRWTAVLSNDEVVHDDNRPNLPAAWTRLREYCEEEKLNIVRLMLEFRPPAVVHILEDNAEGYYFSRGAGAVWGGDSFSYFIAGPVKDGQAHVTWWRVPEFVAERTEVKDITKEDEQQFIIMNTNMVVV